MSGNAADFLHRWIDEERHWTGLGLDSRSNNWRSGLPRLRREKGSGLTRRSQTWAV
jgi:hypothetical protein